MDIPIDPALTSSEAGPSRSTRDDNAKQATRGAVAWKSAKVRKNESAVPSGIGASTKAQAVRRSSRGTADANDAGETPTETRNVS